MTAYSTITTSYTVTATGWLSVGDLAYALEIVPIGSFPASLGLRLTSDTTSTSGQTATRTLVFSMQPATPATITAAVNTTKGGQNKTGEVSTLTVTGNGLDYVRPPVLSFTDASSALASGASAYAQMGVYGVNCSVGDATGGTGYTAPTVTASGGELAPGGAQATFGTVTLSGGGAITAVQVLTTGGPYNSPPTLTVTDTTGSGAVLLAQLGITNAVLLRKGSQYESPSVVITPYFLVSNPQVTGSQQQSTVQGFLKSTIQLALNAPVTADVPQLS